MKKNLLIGLLVVLLGGCAAELAQAPKQNIVPAVGLRTFPKQDWRFPNNKFFLWRKDMTAEHAKRALEISSEIDDLDGAALPLTRQAAEMDAVIDPMKDQQKLLSSNLRSVKLVYDGVTKKLALLKKKISELDTTLGLESEKNPPDLAAIAKLKEELSHLKGEQHALTEQEAALRPLKTKLENDVAKVKESLAPKMEGREALENRRLEIEVLGREKVDEIMKVVDWYKDQPQSLVLRFEKDGTLSASISGWNLGDDKGPRNFSTKAPLNGKPTIRNLTYAEAGGVFTFDVDVYEDDFQFQLRETFSFRLARIKYDTADGRVFFGGEITNTNYEGGQVIIRKGLAKVVDRNN